MSEEKKGIEETLDVLEFLTDCIESLAEAKKNDGKIDLAEWAKAGLANVPSGFSAIKGADQIDDELKDLDDEEKNKLIGSGLDLAASVMNLLGIKL